MEGGGSLVVLCVSFLKLCHTGQHKQHWLGYYFFETEKNKNRIEIANGKKNLSRQKSDIYSSNGSSDKLLDFMRRHFIPEAMTFVDLP